MNNHFTDTQDSSPIPFQTVLNDGVQDLLSPFSLDTLISSYEMFPRKQTYIIEAIGRKNVWDVYNKAQELSSHTNFYYRRLAVDMLGTVLENWKLTYKQSAKFVVEALHTEKDTLVLESLIIAAQYISSPDTLDHILSFKNHPLCQIREAVASILGRFADEASACDALVELAQDFEYDVRYEAIETICIYYGEKYFNTDEVQQLLWKWTDDDDSGIRGMALHCLADAGLPVSVERICSELKRPEVYTDILEVAESLASPELLDPLLDLRNASGTHDIYLNAAIIACGGSISDDNSMTEESSTSENDDHSYVEIRDLLSRYSLDTLIECAKQEYWSDAPLGSYWDVSSAATRKYIVDVYEKAISLSNDDDAENRAIAADLIGGILGKWDVTYSSTVDLIKYVLDTENDSWVLESAIMAVGRAYIPGMLEYIARFKDHQMDDCREAVAWALSEYTVESETKTILLKLSEDPVNSVRYAAICGICDELFEAEFNTRDIQEMIWHWTDDKDSDVRAEAFLGLVGRNVNVPVERMIMELVSIKPSDVLLEAAEKLRSPELFETLIGLRAVMGDHNNSLEKAIQSIKLHMV